MIPIKKLITLSMLFIIGIGFAFRPAPPPGTPSFLIQPAPRITNLHIDCFVIENRLQVAFLAALSFSENPGEITLEPQWPTDSLVLYVIDADGEALYPILRGSHVSIEDADSELMLRLTYEIEIELPVSGPPGPWDYARHFAFYPPFLDASGNVLQPERSRIRFMLPEEIQPTTCNSNLSQPDTLDTLLSWKYHGEIGDTPCRFSE
ncbi:MAG: hypothetical protein ACP5G4_04980 [bacterium]